MKKINPIALLFGVLIILFVTVLLYRAMTAERAFQLFEETVQIRKGDIVYHSVKRPLFGNGFILYQVRIPSLNVPHTIEKVVIRPLPENAIDMRLYNVQVPVIDALRQVYGDNIVSVMQSYQPYRDVLKHPLVTLGVMDIQTARLNLSLTFKPSLTTQTVKGKIALRGLVDIEFSGVLSPLPEGNKNPVFALYAQLAQVSVRLTERGGLNLYRLYAIATGLPLPVGLPRFENGKKTDTLSFTFNPPIAMRSVYLRQPH